MIIVNRILFVFHCVRYQPGDLIVYIENLRLKSIYCWSVLMMLKRTPQNRPYFHSYLPISTKLGRNSIRRSLLHTNLRTRVVPGLFHFTLKIPLFWQYFSGKNSRTELHLEYMVNLDSKAWKCVLLSITLIVRLQYITDKNSSSYLNFKAISY